MDHNEDKPVFGIHPVKEALESGRTIDRIFLIEHSKNEAVKEVAALARMHDVPVKFVPEGKLNRITRKNHQGCIAFISPVDFQPLDEVLQRAFEAGETPLVVLLDGVTDVRNMGAIARSALCAGAHALVIPFKGAAPVNSDAVKTSAGALMKLPVCKVANMRAAATDLRNYGIRMVGCTEKSNDSIFNASLSEPTAVVMGDEEKGLSDTMLKECDELAQIPMPGKMNSLNVSVAAGVVLFECVRQRAKN